MICTVLPVLVGELKDYEVLMAETVTRNKLRLLWDLVGGGVNIRKII